MAAGGHMAAGGILLTYSARECMTLFTRHHPAHELICQPPSKSCRCNQNAKHRRKCIKKVEKPVSRGKWQANPCTSRLESGTWAMILMSTGSNCDQFFSIKWTNLVVICFKGAGTKNLRGGVMTSAYRIPLCRKKPFACRIHAKVLHICSMQKVLYTSTPTCRRRLMATRERDGCTVRCEPCDCKRSVMIAANQVV